MTRFSFVSALVLIIPIILTAQPQISGNISGVLEDTTYLVVGNLTVTRHDTLFIMPGATLLFDGPYCLTVTDRAHLLAIGTEEDSIVFASNAGATEWTGICRIVGEFIVGPEIRLEYCVITGSDSTAVRGYIGGLNLHIANCRISGNQGIYAGGIYFYGTDPPFHPPVISNCLISDNHSQNSGGGIHFCDVYDFEIYNCLFQNNTAEECGGGIYFNMLHNPMQLSNCQILSNTAGEDGGGIFCYDVMANFTLEGCDISFNHSNFCGGGLYMIYSTIILDSCNISHNTSGSDGGGIYGRDNCVGPYIQNCDINHNFSGNNGGGIYIEDNLDNIIIEKSIVAYNEADSGYGGISILYNSGIINIYNCDIINNSNGALFLYTVFEDIQVKNSIIVNNTGYFYLNNYYCCTFISEFSNNDQMEFNNFFNNEGILIGVDSIGLILGTNANGDSCDIYSNIFLDPMFVDSANGDFHLQATSPCIDAGDPNSPLDPDSTIADIGAFYFDQTQAVENPIFSLSPLAFSFGAFPNPFNSSITLRFEMQDASQVDLRIYDISGREVMALGTGHWALGQNEVVWNAERMAGGIYFVSLNSGGESYVKKILLIK